MQVDKELIFEALVTANQDLQKSHFAELAKVSMIVLNKYHSGLCRELKEELQAAALFCLLDRKARYNPKMDAYNYVFTMFRNEMGNHLMRMQREGNIPDFEACATPEDLMLKPTEEHEEYGETLEEFTGSEVAKYIPYLVGEVDFTFLRIPRSAVLNISVFLLKNEPFQVKEKLAKVKPDEVPYLLQVINFLLD